MLPAIDEMPWMEIINFNLAVGTSFANAPQLDELIHRINEKKALAIASILLDNGSETFNVIRLDIFQQAGQVNGKRLYRVAGDSRGGALIPALSGTMANTLTRIGNAPLSRIYPLVITSPTHDAQWIATATDNINVTIIYKWVEHPFPAILKAMLLGELRGEIRQIDVLRSAGGQYFQVPLIKQIGGGQAP